MSTKNKKRFFRHLEFESLEDRLALAAVGLFERLDLSGFGITTAGYVNVQAAGVPSDDSHFNEDDVYSVSSVAALAASNGHYASADEMFTAAILTPEEATRPQFLKSTALQQ